MTDEQIIKGLECCADDSVIRCKECPYGVSIFSCMQMQLRKDALDLINRQKDEIEKLNTVNADMHESLRLACETNKDMQAEIENLNTANVEMQAEIGRMKNNAFCNVVIDEETMRNIVKEKVAEFELDIKSIKAEAIKDFAERLKNKFEISSAYSFGYIACQLDNLVKEMVGDTEC